MIETDDVQTPVNEREEHPAGLVRRLGVDTAYALTALPIVIVSFSLVLTGLVAGASLAWMVLGLPILAATAYVARGFAQAERLRQRSMLGRESLTPEYLTSRPGDGWLRRVTTPLRDPQSWLDIAWSLVSFATGLFAAVLAISWWAVVLNGATYWFWQQWLPDGPEQYGLAELIGLGDSRAAESWLNAGFGVVALLLAPTVLRLAAVVHAGPAEAMLSSRAALQAQVRRATGGRDAAREGEAASLRRLERDIHDGPQQRMVRLAMDLGRARQQIEQDPALARETLDMAYGHARGAIEELRALSRGIAPPLLVDRGLAPALEELVARHDDGVALRLEEDSLHGLAPHVETCLYFVVAEAMTNVAKHAGAERAEVAVRVADGAAVAEVSDDGVGGAHPGKGSGLAGLEQRVQGLGGTLSVSSPIGGPTVVRAEIPTAG